MLLSIIIPVFDGEATLARTLVSLETIAPRNRPGVEIVVIDDGSTDQSPRLLRSFSERRVFPNIVIITEPNGGTAAARNTALRAASGEWIYLLDQDDELLMDPTEFILGRDYASSIAFKTKMLRFGHAVRVLKPVHATPANHLDLATSRSLSHPCGLIFRADAVDYPFREELLYCEDWQFWLANPRVFRNMELHPNVQIANVHIHGKNKSMHIGERGRWRKAFAEVTLAHHPGLSERHRNNLRLNHLIGSIYLGESPSLRPLMSLPARPSLRVKALGFTILRDHWQRFDPYRRRRTEPRWWRHA